MVKNQSNLDILNNQEKLPLVDIIIVNWNGIEHLSVCLTSLINQIYKNKKIIFIDNGSVDQSVEYVKTNFPSIEVISLENNFGFCGGNNVGIRNSESEFIALINNDTEADKYWLYNSIQTLINNPDAGFLASKISRFYEKDLIDSCGDDLFRSGYPEKRGWLRKFSEEYKSNRWVFSACAGAAIYRRSMLDDIGLFDEDYFNYMEDIDLSFRAQLAGYKCIYEPKAIIYHKVGATASQNTKARIYWSHRNHWYTIIKNFPSNLLLKYSLDILIADFFVFISSIIQGNIILFFQARMEVIKNLPKLLNKRKKIQEKKKVNSQYIDSIVCKNWIKQRRINKKLENEFARYNSIS